MWALMPVVKCGDDVVELVDRQLDLLHGGVVMSGVRHDPILA